MRVQVGMASVVMGLVMGTPSMSAAAEPSTGGDTSMAAMLRLGKRDAPMHDPSTIVRCSGEFWTFATGRGVQAWRSSDLVHWEPGPRVFDAPPAWVAEAVPKNKNAHFWAPDAIEHGGRYLLYYSVSSWGSNTSAIGLATNRTLDPSDAEYRWVDEGIVVRSTEDDDFNAIDPAVVRDAEGGLWLSFGSFWSGIKLVRLDPATGKRAADDTVIHALAHSETIEAPCIALHGGRYYLFVNHGLCCKGVESTYDIRVGRSDRIAGPYLNREGNDLRAGGGTLVLGSDGPFIGPGHAGIVEAGGRQWLSCHFYDATNGGRATLAIRPLTWDADGWPVVGVNESAADAVDDSGR